MMLPSSAAPIGRTDCALVCAFALAAALLAEFSACGVELDDSVKGMADGAAESSFATPMPVSIAEAKKLFGRDDFVRVRGTLLAETAPGFFFLKDDTGRIRVRLEEPVEMQSGDLLEVEGVPTLVRNGEWIERATAAVLRHGPLPAAVPMKAADPYQTEETRRQYDGEYVTVHGTVTSHAMHKDRYRVRGAWTEVQFQVLEVDDDGSRVRVMFHPGVDAWKNVGIGTEAEFTGTCRLQTVLPEDGAGQVHVLLPDLAHVKVIRPPPFWERPAVQEGLRVTLLALGLVVAVGGAWAMGERRKVRALRASEERFRLLNLSLEKRVADRTSELASALSHQTELARLKTDFVSLVSHEFRTPLGVIMSATDVLRRYFDRLPSEKRERHLNMIFNSTRNLAALIEEVMLLGRVEEGKMRFAPAPVDLEKLCRLLVDEMTSATAGDCTIEFTAGNDLSGALTDEALLRHIICNLLSNAVKYSERGRRVEFSVRREGADAVLLIRDHGIGIPAEDKDRLFTSFTRGSNVGARPGTGLGLVVVYRCVQLHGGTLALNSTPGTGTTVTVTLPAFASSSVSSPPDTVP